MKSEAVLFVLLGEGLLSAFFTMAFTCMAVIFSFCLMMLFTLSGYFFGLMIRGFFSFFFFFLYKFTYFKLYFGVQIICLHYLFAYHVAIVYSRPTVSISQVLQVALHVFIFLVTTCTFSSNLNKSLLLYTSFDKASDVCVCVGLSLSVCGRSSCMWVILWVIVCVCVWTLRYHSYFP